MQECYNKHSELAKKDLMANREIGCKVDMLDGGCIWRNIKLCVLWHCGMDGWLGWVPEGLDMVY